MGEGRLRRRGGRLNRTGDRIGEYTPPVVEPWAERMNRSELGCGAVAVALVVVGTFSTGLLPSATPYQVLAGGIIVAGFVTLLYCFRGWD